MEMNAVDRLLSLQPHNLVVFKDVKGNICVEYQNCEIKDGYFLLGIPGRGATFEEACEDYMNTIAGKTLVFNSYGNRKEVTVL